MKKAIYRKRLLKLIKHLEHGKLGHPEFDFSVFNSGDQVNHCKTRGCAVGECPVIFPTNWKFDKYGNPILRSPWREQSVSTLTEIQSAATFFGVNNWEAERMFMPLESGLGDKATRKQVAKHLRTFLSPEAK